MSSTDDRSDDHATPQAGAAAPQAPSQDVDARADEIVAAAARVRDEGRLTGVGGRAIVFAHSRLTIAVVLVVVVGALPLLFSVPFFWVALLLPVAVIAWVLWVRTTVTPQHVQVRSVRGTRSVSWDDVRGLELGRRSSVVAVLAEGTEPAAKPPATRLTLPAVKVRDLPMVSLASGGRIPDPAES
ncbi:PH domain-containing protein [Pseudonocardia phyllosphaerae]|uniref:PH domain-containing protein n=1 Tax=Pseudonocardia phyllosphaerae TaxID=3390502 RepID=UPI00397DF2F5